MRDQAWEAMTAKQLLDTFAARRTAREDRGYP